MRRLADHRQTRPHLRRPQHARPSQTPGFQIFVTGWTAKGWNLAKQAFKPFASLTNDGDDEGAFSLDRWPTSEEAEMIRHWCGVGKRPEFSEDYQAELRERALRARQKIGQKLPYEGSAGAKEPREPDAGSQQDLPEDNL